MAIVQKTPKMNIGKTLKKHTALSLGIEKKFSSPYRHKTGQDRS